MPDWDFGRQAAFPSDIWQNEPNPAPSCRASVVTVVVHIATLVTGKLVPATLSLFIPAASAEP